MFNMWILAKYELYSWWSGGGALFERVKTMTHLLKKKNKDPFFAPFKITPLHAPLTYSYCEKLLLSRHIFFRTSRNQNNLAACASITGGPFLAHWPPVADHWYRHTHPLPGSFVTFCVDKKFLNYCLDGGNFHCSSSFLIVTSLICLFVSYL